MNLHCKKCLTSRTGDVLGEPCKTPNCGGVIERQPEFRELVDELPERHTCGRRAENGMEDTNSPFVGAGKNLDYWQKFKSNDDRVCSYCGSLHPDDFFALVKQCADAPLDSRYRDQPEIEPTDKSYKIYVHRKEVRNAHEGGIKFYTHHLPMFQGKIDVHPNKQAEFTKARKATYERWRKAMNMPA